LSSIPVREMIKNAVEDSGGKASYKQIIKWITSKYGDVNQNTIKTQTMACSVNRASRIHLPECGKPRGFDPRYDFLYQTESMQVELYDPKKHGNYELIESNGKTVVAKDGVPISNVHALSLLNFLKNESIMYRNYQPIVIKTLLEKGVNEHFSASIDEIKEKLTLLNFDREDFKIDNAIDAVSNALKNYVEFGKDVNLRFDRFANHEIPECLEICNKEIAKWHVKTVMTDENNVYIIQAGGDGDWLREFQESKTAGVSYHEHGKFDLTGMTKAEIETRTNGKAGTELYNISQIKKGDIVAITLGSKQGIENFGIATSRYYFDLNSQTYVHRVNLEYLNFGTSQINSDTPKAIIKSKSLEDRIKQFLLGEEEHEYFILWRKENSQWEDVTGRKYHFGKGVPNQKKLRNAGIGTKTIWFTKQNGDYYFWGYGAVKEIEVVKDDAEWNLVYDDFRYFEKQDDSLELEGQFLKHGNESINEQIVHVENFNNQHPITRITKKIYEDITGDYTTMVSIEGKNEDNVKLDLKKFIEALKWKPNLILYGPPGTGKTFFAKEIAKELTKKNTPTTAIIWATSDDGNKIEDFDKVIEEEKKVLWGVGWKPAKDKKIVYPITGYIYYKGNVIATAKIIDITLHEDTSKEDLKLRPIQWNAGGGFENTYVHMNEIKRCPPFSHKKLKLIDDSKIIPEVVQQFHYVHDLENNFITFVTFHPSYSYEDFVEGFRPNIKDTGKSQYVLEKGIFWTACEYAKKNPKDTVVLVIDEINRGNIPKILGELITLIEKDKRKEEYSLKLTYSKDDFFVPENLRIIATMNTADKSLMQMDDALKRRFVFEELMPDTNVLLKHLKEEGVGDAEDYKKILDRINDKILGKGSDDIEQKRKMKQFRDRQIGHSYFWDVKNDENLQSAIKLDIIPLLQDYFYGDYDEIRNILGDEIIGKDNRSTDLVKDVKKANELKTELLGKSNTKNDDS